MSCGPALREIFQDRHCARVLLHVLDIVGDHLSFERVDHRLAALFMRPGPAEVADRPEIDIADLERFDGEGGASERGRRREPCGAGL